MFSQFFSTIKVNLVAKIMQSAYLCVIFHVKQKNHHFSLFQPDFYSLVKSKMAARMTTIVGDVTGLQQCHHPQNIRYLVEKITRLSTEGKIVSKYCNISKTCTPVAV